LKNESLSLDGLLFVNKIAFVLFDNIFSSFVGINMTMDGRNRSDVKPGLLFNIVQKHHQRTGELTEGVVKNLLTNSPNHPHGIKVRLETGEVGRVQEILDEE
jgi:uncharacterized repeat protein (TIGR03833 family)